MHNGYPIEQLARSTTTRFQMGFARMTMHLLPQFSDAALEASEAGLRILGANECALGVPAEIIRRLHADEVKFEAPQVRLVYGDPVQEPVMSVTAGVARTCTETVIQDLIRRGAQIEEVEWLATPTVVRATAPLRQLLGYRDALAASCGDTAEVRIWLSHYAPVPPEPEKAA